MAGYADDETVEEDTMEEAFLKGYDDDKAVACAECESMVDPDERITKSIDGEEYVFCSQECADDFSEN